MNKNKIIALVLILCVILMSFAGCRKNSNYSSNKIYYISTDKTSIVARDFDYTTTTISDRVHEAMDALGENSDSVEYMQTIPAGVSIEDLDIADGVVSIYFNSVYLDLDPLIEVLVRAAIVKTITQIVGVDAVAFYVDSKPLENAQGVALGAQTAGMFIEDFGQETDSLLNTTLKLYFASADGTSLVKENRNVYYSSNVSLEKLVIDQLLKGPKTSNLISAIPAETKLLSISVTDGVCYVNFDEAFETQLTGISEKTTIYSVVNSLTELNGINQVLITVGGETPLMANLDVDLSQTLDKSYDIIVVVYEDYDYYDESLNPITVVEEDQDESDNSVENDEKVNETDDSAEDEEMDSTDLTTLTN